MFKVPSRNILTPDLNAAPPSRTQIDCESKVKQKVRSVSKNWQSSRDHLSPPKQTKRTYSRQTNTDASPLQMSSGRKAYSRNVKNACITSNFLNGSECNYAASRTQYLDH